ncbi:Acid phosphatase/vanadium-dependent haloperoxidase-related protein [Zea mays]|uniref:Acid phosphatase/vanadium-dependent haloperoxidase-related protein n=1 Tax=Zea mays TaxID=4577 RepID=A0A1D6N4B6_MAIZE|nr:Acid phosphatase/vanadium-dependent haloperoxidase-related protein [Zea mays]
MGDGGADDASSPPPHDGGFSYLAVFHNYPLVAALLGFAVAQSIKFFLTWYKENRWDPKQLIGSGGMPSSHSATVTALAVAIGLQDGFNCSLFATATIFASVVGYQFSIPTYILLKSR